MVEEELPAVPRCGMRVMQYVATISYGGDAASLKRESVAQEFCSPHQPYFGSATHVPRPARPHGSAALGPRERSPSQARDYLERYLGTQRTQIFWDSVEEFPQDLNNRSKGGP